MSVLTPEATRLIESDALAHLVTLNRDGSPQLSCVWVGLDGDEIVSGHMMKRLKLKNVERDPRIVLSIESPSANEMGLKEYLVVHGSARVEEGGAAALLQRLAHIYMGPDAVFPPPGIDAPGWVLRITPERLGGVGPWA
ncbi:MAG TPA: PPOX class F420-dependent oxidoreductase [Solirubrobacterales bacterium]|jgi:PPOX class probable F420-dependent enzyme|nr:PPOX class F420-dependent oxidoreductase [Solirubrobacterales bacterium]HMU27233.1 PPOX class F420-dependent oxidoreductase [Solirubrobacterales bacterium]HMY26891.1 PPOX class F420-dependent oxidoreductase [Solirubrobacterales bacterium]HNA45521.1 PPOX class F420-dependent oxidoreductase [Solirubrobacterales bacterium]HNC94194.1 PPOX class F420-dependent oxidoreductase [Solirubrobacterales bacterium]